MKKFLLLGLSIECFSVMSAPVKSMLGADGVEINAEEVTYTASDYIQDGLVAMWDGIENAGLGVHDANATVWTDLTGNGWDLTLLSGAINDGRFIWNPDGLWHCGNNYDIRPSFSMADILGSSDNPPFTMEMVVEIERYNTMQRYVPFGIYDGSWGFGYGEPLDNFYVSLPWATGFTRKSFDTILDRTISVSIRTDGERIVSACNGSIFQNAACGNYSIRLSSAPVFFNSVGYNPTVSDSWISVLKSVRVYDRTLSDKEVFYNQVIDNVRFGL